MKNGEEGMDAREILWSLQGGVMNWVWIARGREGDLKATPVCSSWVWENFVYCHRQPILQGDWLCFWAAELSWPERPGRPFGLEGLELQERSSF